MCLRLYHKNDHKNIEVIEANQTLGKENSFFKFNAVSL